MLQTKEKAKCVEEMSIIGEVEDRNVVIIDDMIDTAAPCPCRSEDERERCKSIRAFATHPILQGTP
jgi:ribose-phosphate pyrophosphokinase